MGKRSIEWPIAWPILSCVILTFLAPPAAATLLPASFSGRYIQIDGVAPGFAYYQNRSPASIALEVRARGFDSVSMIAISESAINGPLVKAFQAAGLPVRLQTYGNGVYSKADLPSGWEDWRMVLRRTRTVDGFIYLCINNPAYRAWKKKQVTEALIKHGFDAIDIAECFFPGYGGPGSETYGCFCQACRKAFAKMYPEEESIPDFDDPKTPRYWRNAPGLYRKWVEFRASSVVDFVNDLVNGLGGIRDRCPKVAVCTWTLGLFNFTGMVPDGEHIDPVAKMKEWEGLDAASIVKTVHPDGHCFQTHWPDWMKPDLPADYPKRYKPFIEHLRRVDRMIPIALQIDIGSRKETRRDESWIRQCEKTAREVGFYQTLIYELHLGLDSYKRAPRLISAHIGLLGKSSNDTYSHGHTGSQNTVIEISKDEVLLIFDKRLDRKIASDPASYSLHPGKVLSARCDGNLVILRTSGAKKGGIVRVIRCSDDPASRFFKDYQSPCISPQMSCKIGRWQPSKFGTASVR